MLVRMPNIDYSKCRPHWAPNPEFAQHHNATSTIPEHIEPYLINVLNRAKVLLGPQDAELLREVDIFCKQEGQHFRQHAVFNKKLRDSGYPELKEYETKLRKELLEFLNKRSLKFNLAYSEGFESMGPPSAAMWFEGTDRFLAGADEDAVDLWKWHMAEEFEHREVCFKLFKRLYGRGPINAVINGWIYRVYIFLFTARHLGGYTTTVSKYLISVDRKNMTPEELAASRARLKDVLAAVKRNMMPRIRRVLFPFYNPGKISTPAGLPAFLKRFEPGGDRARV